MSHQLTFADNEFNNKRRITRKEIFLSRMNELMPWDQLEPFYPKAGNGRRPYPLSTMFRIHCVLHWYNIEIQRWRVPCMRSRPCAFLLTYR
jgi:IS5 family transposase